MKIVIYSTKSFQHILENNFSLEGLMSLNLYGKTVRIIGTEDIGTDYE